MRLHFAFLTFILWSTALTSQADLSLELSVDKTQVDVGQVVTFTITLRNDGPETTMGAEVLARLPAGFEFVSAEATDSGTYDPISGIWDATGLGTGITERLRLRARVVRTTDLLLLAEVISSEHWDNDSFPNNGVDTDGDGNTVDDSGDEDDGDGQFIIAGEGASGSGTSTSGAFGECLATVAMESGFTANPAQPVNSVFKFDYKIEAVVKFQMSDLEGFSPEYSRGDPMEILMTYYVNSADGSILFPGGNNPDNPGFFKTNFNYSDRYGKIDGAVWLANGQMVSYVEDEDGKKLAITRESAQTPTSRQGTDAQNMMEFFQSSLTLGAIADPLPDYVVWPSQTKGFRGELTESYTGLTNVIDMHFDTTPTPISTSCIMMGFMVGVLKDAQSTLCNRLVVYTKVHIGGLGSGDSLEAILRSIKPMGITFDGSAYHPMAIAGDYGTAAFTNMDDFEDKMRSIEIRRQTLERQKQRCMNSSRCIDQKNAQLETLRKEKSQMVCEQMVKMGMEDSLAECMRNEGY